MYRMRIYSTKNAVRVRGLVVQDAWVQLRTNQPQRSFGTGREALFDVIWKLELMDRFKPPPEIGRAHV